MTRRHFFTDWHGYYGDPGEQIHESFAIDAADAALFAADMRAWAEDEEGR